MEREKEINGSEALFLFNAATAVNQMLRSGRNPTFQQMERLDAALQACVAEKLCGCLKDDLCICDDEE